MSKVSRFVLAATLALAAGGCSTAVQGTPTPSNPAPQAGSSEANPLASVVSCDLLGKILQGLDYPPAAPDIINKKQACSTHKPGGANVLLQVSPGFAYDERRTNPSKTKVGDIHGRKAIQVRDLGGAPRGCDVKLEVKPHSNVSITVISETTTEQDCSLVDELATRLEPMLPKI
ncbi:DUF3558 family protein [Amycolatopsis minnesotensis]|uniref:DUF3558 domain-containing protein n=1 Tax=Amycolatopsis minnesotensis TaxID=337894 RepID=A0ABN2Q0J4_9PSEU